MRKNQGKINQKNLLSSRKLALFVDLDKTLLQTTRKKIKNVKGIFSMTVESKRRSVKFRPGARRFLSRIGKFYEPHIFSFGTRKYVKALAKLLDPTKEIFADRIISRNDCKDSTTSKADNLTADAPMVCMIDDREDVWNHAENLVPIKPYTFFDGTERKFSRVDKDGNRRFCSEERVQQRKGTKRKFSCVEDDEDRLLCAEKKLRMIHDVYYKVVDELKTCGWKSIPHSKSVVSKVRQSSLDDVRIVFGGFARERSKFIVETLGGTVQNKIVALGPEATTHVVVEGAWCTDVGAVKEARKLKHVHIVTADWLECCEDRWERASEDRFLVFDELADPEKSIQLQDCTE